MGLLVSYAHVAAVGVAFFCEALCGGHVRMVFPCEFRSGDGSACAVQCIF